MGTKINRTWLGATLLLIFSLGCMNQSRTGTSGISRNIFNDQTSGILSGNVNGVGGSGPSGSITQADKQELVDVVKAPELNPTLTAQDKAAGINEAISQGLKDEIEKLRKAASSSNADYTVILNQKMVLFPKIVSECATKANKLRPLPGDPVKGTWIKASGNCQIRPFEVGVGSKQIHRVTGGIANGTLSAFPDGRIEISSQSLNGSGQDSDYQNDPNQSGIATLTGKIAINSKGGTTYQDCSAKVVLDKPNNQMPENHDKAMELLGSCYQLATAVLGMQSIFSKIDPRLADVLFQQMTR